MIFNINTGKEGTTTKNSIINPSSLNVNLKIQLTSKVNHMENQDRKRWQANYILTFAF